MSALRRPGALGVLILLAGSLSACAAGDASQLGLGRGPLSSAEVPFSTTGAASPGGETLAHAAPPPVMRDKPEQLTPAEIAYVDGTAAAIYRRRAVERATAFVPTGEAGGYGICVRSPAAKGGYDVALVVIARRLYGDAISQVDDDTVVLRRAADTGVCRQRSVTYVPARTG